MKFFECYPKGNEKSLEEQISSILHNYFPNLPIVQKQLEHNKLMESKECNEKTDISLSLSFLMSAYQKEREHEEKIDNISLKIEEPDVVNKLPSEIFLG